MRKAFVILAGLLLALCIGGTAFGSTVDISAPPNNSTISGDSVQIVVNFDAGDQTLADKVVVKLDGNAVTHREFGTALTSGSSTFKWDTTRTPNGKHKIDITLCHGKDVLGAATCEVVVSNGSFGHLAPMLKVSNMKEDQTVSGTAAIVVQASSGSGIDPLVSISVDNAVKSVSNRAPFKYDWDTTGYMNGPHYIDVSAIDDLDQSSKIKTLRVIVRNPIKAAPLTSRVHEDELVMPAMAPLASKAAKVAPKLTASELPRVAKESARAAGAADEKLDASQLQSASSVKAKKSEALPTINIPMDAIDENQQASVPAPAPTAKPAAPKAVAPKVVASLPTGTEAQMSEEPALAGSLSSDSLRTSASSVAKVSTPVVKSKSVAHGSASKLDSAPALSTEANVSRGPVASKSETLSTPVGPVSAARNTVGTVSARATLSGKVAERTMKTSASGSDVRLLAPSTPKAEATSTMAKVSVKPVLMAKLLKSEAQPQVMADRRICSPSAKKATAAGKCMVTAKAPAKACPCNGCQGKCVAPKSQKCVCTKSVGVRALFGSANGTVNWNAKKKTVHAVAAHKDLKLRIGSRKAELNNKTVKMDRSAYICNGRTMISGSFAKNTLQLAPAKK